MRLTKYFSNQKFLNILILGVLIGVGAGALVFAGLGLYQTEILKSKNPQSALQDQSFVPSVGNPAPDFELENLDGETIRLSNFRGKPVAINFWATWCSPCVFELPIFQKHYIKNKNGIEILAVNNQESTQIVKPFVEELGLTFEILLDQDADINRLYQVIGLPTTYFIDKEGIIRIKHVGVLEEDQFLSYLEQIGVTD